MPTSPTKVRLAYVCSGCGASLNKWAGRCPDCGAWNSVEELPGVPATGRGRQGYAGAADSARVLSLEAVSPERETRTSSGIAELDRVLGGGLVAGSVVLIGGDPGIGKSTLLLQACAALSASPGPERPVLYVTGEESPQQVSLRARRLGLSGAGIRLLAETGVERILAAASSEQPRVLVVDSIQTTYTDLLPSAPGSVSQVRETAAQLAALGQAGRYLRLPGGTRHQGRGPGGTPGAGAHGRYRPLFRGRGPAALTGWCARSRTALAPSTRLGVFAMTDRGLKEVRNPSAIFLSRHDQPVPGSLVMITREGTRPLMVEVQALVDESPLANPRRVALGLEQNRLSMLLAVLHRHGGLAMFDRDVFVNVVGGVRITETAADLAVLLAVLSSYRDRPLDLELAVFGEVGLSGEIRPVPNGPDRLREAAKHGIKRVIAPKGNVPKGGVEGLEILEVRSLKEAIDGV